MLSLANKSDAFIENFYKNCFYKMENLEKKKVLCYCLWLLSRKCALQSFSGIVTDHFKFYL